MYVKDTVPPVGRVTLSSSVVVTSTSGVVGKAITATVGKGHSGEEWFRADIGRAVYDVRNTKIAAGERVVSR